MVIMGGKNGYFWLAVIAESFGARCRLSRVRVEGMQAKARGRRGGERRTGAAGRLQSVCRVFDFAVRRLEAKVISMI